MVSSRRTPAAGDRMTLLLVLAGALLALIVVRLFSLQILQHGFYQALAEGQHSLYEKLFPTRGRILASERGRTELFPLATNEPRKLVYVDPSLIVDDPAIMAERLEPILGVDRETLRERLNKTNDRYEPLKHAVGEVEVKKIRELGYAGIAFSDELVRFYPEGRVGSHVLGFLGYEGDQRKGQYGIEGAFEKELAGELGHLAAERDAAGRWIATGSRSIEPARDGDDVVLTIDRVIQHEACTKLDQAVEKHGADGGSVVVLDPKSGAVLAMCGNPNFDPNEYAQTEDPAAFANPAIFAQYEPGSIMKPFTMAAALELGRVTPTTTYTDEGSVQIGKFTIKNSDAKAHGVQTMTQVLEQSLNTGAIFAMRQIGPKAFGSYIQKFGFGKKTDITLQGEVAGDVSSLKEGKEIYAATASYGQGVTVTPLQLAAAFGAIANRGVLMKPYIVKEIRHPDGTITATQPSEIRNVISPQTATTLSAMLVNVVRNGHGKRAGVSGYYLAGKTGTAQVPKKDGPGYDPNITIGSFGGFGPVEDPVFVMVVRIDRPRDVQFAESTAAPLFGEIANFILQYFDIPPKVVEPSE